MSPDNGSRGSRRVDWDRHALQTNLLANAVILLTGCVSLLATVALVVRRGSPAVRRPPACDWIIVPGHALEADAPSGDFRARLDRALALARAEPAARILVLGGLVPGQVCSEAEAGGAYLRARGIAADRITLEDASRHTLENFQRALGLLGDTGDEALVLVTNRYHLARAATMAANLGLRCTPCPAEARWKPRPRLAARIAWEAYLLHWYHVGRLFARLTGNQGMLDRVSRRPRID